MTSCFIACSFQSFTASGQELILPGNGKVFLKELAVDTVYYLPVKITQRPASDDIYIKIKDKELPTATAARGRDYDYVAGDLSDRIVKKESPDYFSIGVLIKAGRIRRDTVRFQLSLYVGSKSVLIEQPLHIAIVPAKGLVPPTQSPDTSRWSVSVVTGSNFDFFEKPAFKNFAGDISIWTPDLMKIKAGKKQLSFGLHAGFFNYRYFESDTSRARVFNENYLLDPRSTKVADTTRYIRESYSLEDKTTFNTVGAFLNPILTLKQDKWFDMYLSGHFEILYRTETSQQTKVTLRTDTLRITAADMSGGIVIQSLPGRRPQYTKRSFQDVYLGVGLPVNIRIKSAFDLMLAPTIGVAFFSKTVQTPASRNGITYRESANASFRELFLLTKVQLKANLTKSVGVVLGGEFRRVFNGSNLYALYIGAAIPVEKLIR